MKKYFVSTEKLEGGHFKVGQLVLCHDWMEKYLVMSSEKNKLAIIDSLSSCDGFTSVKFLDGSFGLSDFFDYVSLSLMSRDDIEASEPKVTKMGEISKHAKWVKSGDEFDEDEIRLTYLAEIKKTYTNGETTHWLEFTSPPTNDDIEEQAKYWAEHIDGCGWNNGYKIYWPTVDELELGPIKVKCDKCNTFH